MKSIEIKQKLAIRAIIDSLFYSPYDTGPLFKTLKILPFDLLVYNYFRDKSVYEFRFNTAPCSFANMWQSRGGQISQINIRLRHFVLWSFLNINLKKKFHKTIDQLKCLITFLKDCICKKVVPKTFIIKHTTKSIL